MIATFIAFAALAQTPAPQGADTSAQASQLISKMLGHYYKAKKVVGTILLTTTAGNVSGRLLTTLQYDDPSKLYIRQDLQAADQGVWKIVSDGTVFTYPVPQTQLGDPNKALFERVFVDGEQRSFRDIYAIGAGGLKDRNAPLDIAIGRYDDLKLFKGHLTNYSMGQPVDLRGKHCSVVEGGWRDNPLTPPTRKFRLVISEDGDLMQYEILDHILNPADQKTVLDVRQTWDVDLQVNGQTHDEYYRLG